MENLQVKKTKRETWNKERRGRLFKKVFAFWMILAMVFTSGNFDGVQIAKAAGDTEPTITLTYAGLKKIEVEEKGENAFFTDKGEVKKDEIDFLDGRESMNSKEANDVIHMDINSCLTFNVDCSEGNWGAALTDKTGKTIGGISVKDPEAGGSLMSKWETNNKIALSKKGEQLSLYIGKKVHDDKSDLNLYVYNYGDDIKTAVFIAKIQTYNGVEGAEIKGDDFIVATKKKTYSVRVAKTDLDETQSLNTSLSTTDQFIWSVKDKINGDIGEETGVFTAADLSAGGSSTISVKATNGIKTPDASRDFIVTKKRTWQGEKKITISKANPANEIKFDNENYDVQKGQQLFLSSLLQTKPEECTDVFEWETSDEKIATVSKNGIVTAIASGETTITVRGETQGIYATCKVHVYIPAQEINTTLNEKAADTVSLRKGNIAVICVKEFGIDSKAATETLEAVCKNEDLLDVSEVDSMGNVDTKYYRIKVKGIVDKETECTVTFKTKEREVYKDFKVKVFPPIQDNVELSLKYENEEIPIDSLDVYIGDKSPCKVNASFVNITDDGPDSGDQVDWKLENNNDFLTYDTDDICINLNGAKKGIATLVATARSNAKVTKSVSVRVLQAASALQLSNSNLTMSVGATQKLASIMTPETSDETINWTSTNTEVASVDADGKVVAVGKGTASITGTTSHSKIAATCNVEVKAASGITLDKININAQYEASEQTITATVKDASQQTVVSPAIAWSSSNEEVVVVTSKVAGKATLAFGKVGTAYVTAKYGQEEAKCLVTVTESMANIDYETELNQSSSEVKEYIYQPNGKSVVGVPSAICNHDSRMTEAGKYILVEDTDYTVQNSAKDVLAAGSYTYTMTGKGCYTGSKVFYYKVSPKDISELQCTIPDQLYTGSALNPGVSLVYTVDGETQQLVEGTDYNISYQNNTAAGIAKAIISGKGNFTGSKEVEFTIDPYNVKDLLADITKTPTYTGKEVIPGFDLKYGDLILRLDKDYQVSYSNNINACTGAGVIQITAVEGGNYTGQTTANFSIDRADISKVSMTIPEQTYTGKAIMPEMTVTWNGNTLERDKDYTVVCTDNVNVGTANVEITGIGNYTGTKSSTFRIVKADLSKVTIAPIADQYSAGSAALKPNLQITNGDVALVAGVDYVAEYTNNTALGTATVAIKPGSNGNYTGSATTTFAIVLKEVINVPAESISVVPEAEAAMIEDTIYVDVDKISSYHVTLTSTVGECDDIVYVSGNVDEKMFSANTELITGGTDVLLNVKGLKPGTTKLYLETMSGKIRKALNVEVYSPATEFAIEGKDSEGKTATISGGQVSLIANHTLQLSAKMKPTDSTDNVEWSVNDTSIATVNEDGLLTALKPGTVRVTGTIKATETGARGLQVSGIVTVIENIPATAIRLNKTELTMKVGATETLVSEVLPTNNTEQLVWKSSDEAVATVSESGKVKAVSQGTATITCSNFEGNVVASCVVNVYSPATAITMSASEKTLKIGDVFELNASLTPTTAVEKIKWTVSKEGVVSIKEKTSGVVNKSEIEITALAAGTVVVTATSETTNKVAKCTITVAAADTGVQIEPGKTEQDKTNSTEKLAKVIISSAKNVKAKSIKLAWKKVTGAEGYQLAYGNKKNFAGSKKKLLKGNSCKITKLKKKKTYYVRVRAYQTVSGKKEYGAWSSAKKIKVNK